MTLLLGILIVPVAAFALPWLIHAWQVRTGRWQAP